MGGRPGRNSLRHAQAGNIDIALTHDAGQVTLSVSDDGVGFTMSEVLAPGRRPASYGLRGMAERAELLGGRVTVTSRPLDGTTVRAVIPLR